VLPFEGLRPEAVPRRCRHRRCCLSWGWPLFRVLYAFGSWGSHWFPTPTLPSAFPSELVVSTARRPST